MFTSRKFLFLFAEVLLWMLSLGAVFILGLTVERVSAKEPSQDLAGDLSPTTTDDQFNELRLFTNVLSIVQRYYYKEVDFRSLVEGAVKGMLMTLDPHSGYMPKQTFQDLQVETKGEFGGLGIEITIKDNFLTVVAPIEDSPAFRAGVQAGDQIIKIGDEFTKDMTMVDAVSKMRGPRGTPVIIAVHRNGYPDLIPITVVRDTIKVKSVRFRLLKDGVGYLRLSQFQEGSGEEFEKALKALRKANAEKDLAGLVIDLRNNPGGLLTQAIKIADIFLKDGIIVYTEGRAESQKQKFSAHNDNAEPTFPLAVLVNGGSASASEIISGAFQDHGRAITVGTKTFGKGSVQTILPVGDGAALRLTTALYYTKSGRTINHHGITPDYVMSARRYSSDAEELLEKDVKFVNDNKLALPGVVKKEELPPAEQERLSSSALVDMDINKLLKEDPQLEGAMTLLLSGAKPVEVTVPVVANR